MDDDQCGTIAEPRLSHSDQKPSVEVELTVAFHDVDMMEIVWHGHYARYFEAARDALLDRLDYNYAQMRASGYSWPVVDMRLRYARPARFKQRLRVRATLSEWQQRMKIVYEIRDAESGERLTRGHTVQVAVELTSGVLCSRSPAALIDRLEKLT
ncbi:acyl-CoA thioesterase [Phytohalomonas tamaricis]|uniref:acyl-CoA thioesterase n=1 Tax=Phytohalomonas tamaricis TaxID=2081032 RepID=UPI000D0ABA03|nr:thioesterase family protein [Phytohalomonas tamaricis]